MRCVTSESLHVGERIGRPAQDVYEYAVDPANILGSPSEDGVIHACIWGSVVRCFILPARM